MPMTEAGLPVPLRAAASEEIAEKLGCELYLYDNLGHAAYEEAKDFNKRAYAFFAKNTKNT